MVIVLGEILTPIFKTVLTVVLICKFCEGYMRLLDNNYEHFHVEHSIMLWACEEGQSWDKDSGDREKGTVNGSMSEKEMRGFRKRLVCGMKTK